MSTKSKFVLVGSFAAAAIVCFVLTLGVGSATVVPMAQSGAQVTPGGWMSLVLSLFGTGGFSVAAIVALLMKVKDEVTLRLGDTGKVPAEVFFNDAAIMALQKFYSAATTPALKTALRAEAKGVIDAEYEKLFPVAPAA